MNDRWEVPRTRRRTASSARLTLSNADHISTQNVAAFVMSACIARFLLLSTCLSMLLVLSDAQFLTQPAVSWRLDLPGGNGSMRRGNGLAASWHDENRVYATTAAGGLHIVNRLSDSQTSSIAYQPATVSGTVLSCASRPVLMKNSTSTMVESAVVYAVIETPDGQVTGLTTTSRVLAVHPMRGTLLWQVTVAGTIAGSPVVGFRGDTVYVTHNAPGNTTTTLVGRMTVIAVQLNSAGTAFRASVTASYRAEDIRPDALAPFGPPAGQTYRQGGVRLDLIAFGELSSTDGTTTSSGGLYLLAPSDQYTALNGQGQDAYQCVLASTMATPTITKPALGAQMTLYLGQVASVVSGWTDTGTVPGLLAGVLQAIFARWTSVQALDGSNSLAPIPCAPVLSSDSTKLFVAAAGWQVAGIETSTGNVLWSLYTTGSHTAEPVVSNGQVNGTAVVYFIESYLGVVRQFDAETGVVNWNLACSVASCYGAVEADFSISPSGNTLFYGDTTGRIIALTVASFATPAPTVAPTAAPTLLPTIAVTPSPTAFPTTVQPSTAAPIVAPIAPPTQMPVARVVPIQTAVPTGVHNNSAGENPTSGPSPFNRSTDTADGGSDTPGDGNVSPSTQSDNPSSGSSTAYLVIALGCLCGAVFALLLGYVLFLRRRRRKAFDPDAGLPPVFSASGDGLLGARRLSSDKSFFGTSVLETRDMGKLDESDRQREVINNADDVALSPVPGKAKRANSLTGSSPRTMITLESIAESPDDFDDQTLEGEADVDQETGARPDKGEGDVEAQTRTDSPVAKNLFKSFDDAASPVGTNADAIVDVNFDDIENQSASAASGANEDTFSLGSVRSMSPKPVAEATTTDMDAMVDTRSIQSDSKKTPLSRLNSRKSQEHMDEISLYRKKAGSPANRTLSPTNRAASPALSEGMSLDESLYIDENTTIMSLASTITKESGVTSMFPDDQSLKRRKAGSPAIPPATSPVQPERTPEGSDLLGKDVPPGSHYLESNPISVVASSRGHAASRQSSASSGKQGIETELAETLAAPAHKGMSVRPRAGLFSRSRQDLLGPMSKALVDEEEEEEAEGSAVTGPGSPESEHPTVDLKAPFPEPKASPRTDQKKQTAPAPTDAWSTFLNELSKAEQAFFNPKLPSSKTTQAKTISSPPSTPPRSISAKIGSSSSPLPPPPPAAAMSVSNLPEPLLSAGSGSNGEEEEDEDYSDTSTEPPPVPPRH